MQIDWIDRVTSLVKTAPDARSGWPLLVDLCRKTQPDALWDALPEVHAKRDVAAASQWLRAQLRNKDAPHPPRGVYLGLNTLNMDGDDGHNVEIGATENCDPSKLETDWAYQCEWYGDLHLIESLRDLKSTYDQPQFESVSGFADYALFLGYSGLVLAEAMDALEVSTPLLAAWGFHDGDLFFLGRRDTDRFERICRVF